jgi:hypothetical protein
MPLRKRLEDCQPIRHLESLMGRSHSMKDFGVLEADYRAMSGPSCHPSL